MLQRIISIKGVGRFRNCGAAGDVSFRRYTLIFAENGRGKTTLCAILRSLYTNASALVLGRATLGNQEPPEIQLLIDGANVAFRGGAWSAAYPHIEVFDGTYVSENVFAGDAVDTEHRRNLYKVIIGARGVTLAARITEIDAEIGAKNREIRDNRTAFQRQQASGMTPEAFIALPADPEIDAKISASEQTLQATQRSAQLQQRAELASVNMPAFPPGFAALLAKTYEQVAGDAEQQVAEHLERHHMQGRGEPWLTEGLRYVAADQCPFCAQSLDGVGLIQAFRAFFSRDYHALRDEATALTRQLDAAFGERAAAAVEQTLVQNAGHVEFWQQYCDVAAPGLPQAGTIADIVLALRHAAGALLQVKAASPLEAVPPGDEFTHALASFNALREAIAAYNEQVAAANALIGARKREARTADERTVQNELDRLRAQKARHTDEVRQQCEQDATLQADKQRLEEEKVRVREQLDAHTAQVIQQYGASINRYLERINAGFRITTPTHTYRGGTPSTSYQILINQSAVDLGDAATPPDRPSFRNTLSAGDRSTLALAFFLAQLEQNPDRASKVVVFDDPFTSLDSFRRNHTIHQIFRCGVNCAQVVLLSHDPAFLKLLWDRIAPADRKTLQFVRVGEDNTNVVEWDIEKAVMARFHAQLDALQRFYSDNEGEPRDIIRDLRPVLEAYARNLYPTQFDDDDTLGVIVGKIRGAGGAHLLFPVVDDMDEINVYCRRYHHGESPGAATEPVDNAELHGYVRKTLNLVGCSL
ncbi:MAG: AAA family ATPase [Burkholderiales bacterium]